MVFVSPEDMAGFLDALSAVMPFTYAYDALARATRAGELGGGLAVDVLVIVGATVAALALGAMTLRRRTG